MSLTSLVYVSFASYPFTETDFLNILEQSRANNARLDITGMLLYRDRFIVQALEGEAAAIELTFGKISRDPRHDHVLRVYTSPIPARTFPNWTMGFNPINDRLKNPPDGYSDFLSNPSGQYFIDKPGRAAHLMDAFRASTYY